MDNIYTIIAAVIGAAATIIASRYTTKNKSDKRNDKSTDVVKNKPREEPVVERNTPEQIKNAIKAVPPYQQDTVAESYVGLDVTWNLKFTLIHKRKDHVILQFYYKDAADYPDIEIKTTLDEYPLFKSANKHDPFEIGGKIIKCEIYRITLDPRYIKCRS